MKRATILSITTRWWEPESRESYEKASLLSGRNRICATPDPDSHVPVRSAAEQKDRSALAFRVGPENFRPLIRLKIADRVGNRRQPRKLEPGTWQTIRLLREIERDRDALTLRDLKINGNDLIAMGMSPGPLLGEILNSLMEQVLDDPSCNRRGILLERAKNLAQNRFSASERREQ
jgi:hypothetical protein